MAGKVLAGHLATDPIFHRCSRREALAAARLRHPHRVRAYDLGEENGALLLRRGPHQGHHPAPVGRATPAPRHGGGRSSGNFASALDTPTPRAWCHRDLKPGNVLVDGQRAVLAACGIARARNAS